jgi:uncharacterized protein with NRDE domain
VCLAIIARAAQRGLPLVVAANRDEYHARPTAPASWGTTAPFVDVLAGRDLKAGGTWLGVTRQGAFALVTNVREPGRNNAAAPSRGKLVPTALRASRSSEDAQEAVRMAGQLCNGYNLIFGGVDRVTWTSNRATPARELPPGIHGISNAGLDTPWPKLTRTRERVATWAERGDPGFETLFAIMADRAIAADSELPDTGVSTEWERRLSAPFIVSPEYGTRSTSIYALGDDGRAYFEERSFDHNGTLTGRVVEEFRVTG